MLRLNHLISAAEGLVMMPSLDTIHTNWHRMKIIGPVRSAHDVT